MCASSSQENFDASSDREQIGKYSKKQLKEIFNKYKVGESIDITNLQKLLKEHLDQAISFDAVNRLMSEIDQDGNGTLELNEFYDFMKKFDEQDEDVLKEVFMIFDREGKGYLTPESVYHVFLSLGENIKLEDIENILKENDIDGDGNLNFQDFKNTLRNGLEELNRKSPTSSVLNISNNFNVNHGVQTQQPQEQQISNVPRISSQSLTFNFMSGIEAI